MVASFAGWFFLFLIWETTSSFSMQEKLSISGSDVPIQRWPDRQFDPEIASAAGFRLDPGPSAHALDSALHDSQANTCSGIGILAVQPLEGLENSFLVLLWNSNPLVTEP